MLTPNFRHKNWITKNCDLQRRKVKDTDQEINDMICLLSTSESTVEFPGWEPCKIYETSS